MLQMGVKLIRSPYYMLNRLYEKLLIACDLEIIIGAYDLILSLQTINAIRYMSPYSTINVTVIGSEGRDYREFRAKLVTVYTDEEGYGWSKSLSSIEAAV